MDRINKMFNIKELNMKKLFFGVVALVLMFCGCASTNSTEKYHSSRDNVINVKDKIHEIDFGDVVLHNASFLCNLENYLVAIDHNSYDDMIFVFDKEDYHFLRSTGRWGQGPFEYVSIGNAIDNHQGGMFVSDFGSYQMRSYNLDSLVNDSTYTPFIKCNLIEKTIPTDFHYVNDTFSIAQFTVPTSVNTFYQTIGIFNMLTGDTKIFDFAPRVDKQQFTFAASEKHRLVAECNTHYDMVSIVDFDGNLQCNIYGPDFETTGLYTFSDCCFANDYLLALYNGDNWTDYTQAHLCQVFNKNGDYVATLDLGYSTFRLSYDETKNRLYLSFIDTIQFGYLDLDEIKL